MRTVYLLWKLWRRLEKAKRELRAASINVVVELETAASYRAARDEATALGLPPPARRTGWEVSLWANKHEALTGTATKRGETLAEALGRALRG